MFVIVQIVVFNDESVHRYPILTTPDESRLGEEIKARLVSLKTIPEIQDLMRVLGIKVITYGASMVDDASPIVSAPTGVLQLLNGGKPRTPGT